VQVGVVDAARHQPDPLGLLPRHRLAQQQVVLASRHAAEQRPDNCGMITRRNPETGMPIDDSCGAPGDRDVGKQSDHQAGTHRRTLHSRNDWLGAIDNVVHEISSLSKHPDASSEVLSHLSDQVQVTSR
jgi:hypothetical protein